MQNLISKFKTFNSNHKKLVPFLIYFEILVIVLASIFKGIKKHFVAFLIALLAIVVIIIAIVSLSGGSEPASESSNGSPNGSEIVETVVSEGTTEGSGESFVESATENSTEGSVEGSTVEAVESSSEEAADAAGDAGNSKASNSKTSNSNEKGTDAVETASTSDNTDNVGSTGNADASSSASTSKVIVDTIPLGVNVGGNVSKEAFDKFVQRYTDTIGWLYFEDDRLSYPIMRSDDNDKYSKDDYAGNDSETGAIFLDFRCDPDFSDPNSIIYGHNMRNRTMFGALKIYKEDLSFLNEHKYFQIRTSEGTSRYMIFAFMDVPKDSYIFDVYGENPANMREYLDTIEYKTYIDTGIEPTVDDQIVMLSTCTKSDDLYFVMFAVKVEE